MQIYNTLTKQKDDFLPPGSKVRMFVCGPTVYDYIHVGNARTYTIFDMAAKYLRYRGYEVEYIQNITDIDDKIIARALNLKLDPLDYAKDYTDLFLEDVKKLGINSVSHYEPATKNIEQVIKQVKTLIEKGNAYKIENDGWYFDLKTFPEYGKLSGRTIEMAEDGVSRIDESPDKRNRGDFCLWKFSKPEEPGWDSELGYGRPGWHIEDTAITEKFFGPQYDLHGGGADLIFPHHEAEIAQQESASGLKPFVRYWMHAGLLVNKNQKMSKSLGNFMILREALKKYSPEVLRFYFLSSHYRSPLDYSEELLKQSEAATNRLVEFIIKLHELSKLNINKNDSAVDKLKTLKEKFITEMDDDFNTPSAIARLFDFVKETNTLIDMEQLSSASAAQIVETFNNFNKVLGIIPEKLQEIPTEIQNLVNDRADARKRKDFAGADELRKQIKNLGYEIEDTTYGPLIKKLPQAP